MQYTVFVVTILLMLVVTAAFAIVALNASKRSCSGSEHPAVM